MASPDRLLGRISHISKLTPSSLERAWLSAPHPHLPLLATCASDKSVRIYSLTSFTQLSVISGGHKRSVRSCAWKPNLKSGSVLATGSFDASVGIWRGRAEGVEGQASKEVDFTGGGVSGPEGDEEDDEEWDFVSLIDGHDSEVKSISWSAGGNFLATCSRDKSVWIWEEVGDDDYETIAVLQEHTADVKCVAWHPEEELLASGSYDDDIRLWKEDIDDWGCVGLLRGHSSTVWTLDWEGLQLPPRLLGGHSDNESKKKWLERRESSGPRLISSSDDMTIRVWRRIPKEKHSQNALSTIRTDSNMEDWVEEAILPQMHERAIYAVAWNKQSGRVVSCGGDGKLVVYEERWVDNPSPTNKAATDDSNMSVGEEQSTLQSTEKSEVKPMEWTVLAEINDSHGVFEVNHVTWARRADSGKSEGAGDDIIVSTGDDGSVQVWNLET